VQDPRLDYETWIRDRQAAIDRVWTGPPHLGLGRWLGLAFLLTTTLMAGLAWAACHQPVAR
jgi:hypothetical protein